MFRGPGKYTFRSLRLPDRCIDIPSHIAHRDEGRVQQFLRNGSIYQQWVILEANGRPGRYLIHSQLGRDKFLGVEGDSNLDFARVFFQKPRETAYQHWRLDHIEGEAYRFYNDGSGLCIDVREENTAAGGDLQQRPRLEISNQLWAIDPA